MYIALLLVFEMILRVLVIFIFCTAFLASCNRASFETERKPGDVENIVESALLQLPGQYHENAFTGLPVETLKNFKGNIIETGVSLKVNINDLSVPITKEIYRQKYTGPTESINTNRVIVSNVEMDDTVMYTHIGFELKPKLPEIMNSKGIKVPLAKSVKLKGEKVQVNAENSIPALFAPKRDLASYNIRYYDSGSGLNSAYITCMYKDSRDKIWFGTNGNGITTFDGSRFQNIGTSSGFPGDVIRCILEDLEGNIWIGTEGAGIVKYDGTDYTVFNENHGISNATILSGLCDKQGNLWFGTNGSGVIKYDGQSFEFLNTSCGLPDDFILGFCNDKGNNGVWISTGKGFSFLQNNHIVNYSLKGKDFINAVFAIESDNRGRVWIGTYNQGLYLMHNAMIYRVNKLVSSSVTKIKNISDNEIWVGTSDGGAVSFSEDTVNEHRFYLQAYSKAEGLTSNHVTDICMGNQGDVWMTTFGGGVSVLCKNDFYKFPFPDNLENIFPQDLMFRKNGDVWITTSSQGLFIKKGDSLHHLTPDCGMYYNNPSALCEDDSGNVWIGIDGAGMLKFTGEYFYFYSAKIGMKGLVVKDLHFDSKNRLWVATQDSGVFCLNNNSFAQFSVGNGFLCSNYVRTIYEQKNGNIWFCTAGGGITRFDGESIIHFTEKEGLPGNDITDIHEDSKGNLWIATAGVGVARLSKSEILRFSDGLTSNYIRSVVPVSTDSILLGTERGIAVLKFSESEINNSGFRIYSFLGQQGLSSEYINTRGIHIDNEGNLWALTATGIDIKKSPEKSENNLPVVNITECFINNRKINFHSNRDWNGVEWDKALAFYNVPENMKLEHFNNSIYFHFSSGISFFNKSLEYSYLLVGYDDDWSLPVSSPFAEYKELPFGEYEFKVRVRLENGEWSSPDIFSFYIYPPWWHTWWARLLYSLLAIIFLFSMIRWRTASLKKRQSELEKEISMATMEIRKQRDEVEQQKEIIEFAHSDIKSSILYAKRIQNAILPSSKIMNAILSESFVLYLPKDIVAGDFYWLEHKDNQILFAAADCTGHGVPGAMVSVVCNNALNRAVREFGLTDPGKILDKTREIVISEFDKSEDDVKDGMDISLCSLTSSPPSEVLGEVVKLQWAGANNPLWIISPFRTHWPESWIKGNGWAEARPDKQPIGKYSSPQPFTNYSIDLQKGDTIYIFTDGFQDQFGGEKGKKYKAARLKSFLISIVHQPMEVQRELLLKEFEQWRDKTEQIDDVCIIGVRL